MSMSRQPDRTPPSHSHASHAPLHILHSSSSPLVLDFQTPSSASPTHTDPSSNGNSTTSHHFPTPVSPPPSMDEDDDVLPANQSPVSTPSTRPPSIPVREDCWLEDATFTLIEAWGERYVELKRGNLRQKHWQEVADAVNARHGHSRKTRRTDIQCKNRIDTLKKKYKIEKSKISDSDGVGNYTSPWPFFDALDSLIGSSFKPSPPVVTRPHRKRLPVPPLPALPPPSSVPVGPRSKRSAPLPAPVDKSYFRRNFSAVAAAETAVEAEGDSYTSRSSAENQDVNGAKAYRQLAEAIGSFGEIYQRVEEAKQRQAIELEKQRMQFVKDLELEKMKLLMDLELKKMKRSKRTSEPGQCF